MQPVALKPHSDAPIRLMDRQPVATDAPGVRLTYDRDEEIFGQGEPARNVYRVLSGAVRTYRVLADGRRQIVEFLLPGDVFGLEGDSRHSLGAEAVNGATVQVIRRAAFLADRTEAGAPIAVEALMTKVQRAQDHMLMLGRQTACERVSAFLLDFQRRTPGEQVELPMSRQDIADYLGLTIETVSRTLTHLQGAGLIDLVSCRRIVLRNVGALDRISQ